MVPRHGAPCLTVWPFTLNAHDFRALDASADSPTLRGREPACHRAATPVGHRLALGAPADPPRLHRHAPAGAGRGRGRGNDPAHAARGRARGRPAHHRQPHGLGRHLLPRHRRDGYQPEVDAFPDYAFFPAYPALVLRHLGADACGDAALAAVLASNVALFAALVVLYALSVRHLRPIGAIWSLWSCPRPGAVGFTMSYTEGLFLLFAGGAFLAAETRHPWMAGMLLAAATLTRVPGILLLCRCWCSYISRDGLRPTLRTWIR